MFVRHGDAHVAQDVQARLVIAVCDEPGGFLEGLFDLLRRRHMTPTCCQAIRSARIRPRTVASVSRWAGSGAG
jgi:hypothetical protein